MSDVELSFFSFSLQANPAAPPPMIIIIIMNSLSSAKQAKCPLTDPFKRPQVALYEGHAGQVQSLRLNRSLNRVCPGVPLAVPSCFVHPG